MTSMRKEAVRFAATTRIIAFYRGRHQLHRFRFFIRNHVKLQANIRRKIQQKKTSVLMSKLFEDWLFRLRYRGATLMQSAIRRYNARCRTIKVIAKIREQQIKIQRAARKRKAKLRSREKASILYKQCQRINGLTVVIRVLRKDARNYSQDFGIVVEVYIPESQDVYKFIIEEPELRKYICIYLNVEACNVQTLLEKANLIKIVSTRLMCKKSNKPGVKHKVVFSRQGLGQKGEMKLKMGIRISGNMFVCMLYETGTDVTVQCYHMYNSAVYVCYITKEQMVKWITDIHIEGAKTEVDKYKTPFLLKQSNQKALYQFLIRNIITDTRHNTFKLVFRCQLEKSRKMASIKRIQGTESFEIVNGGKTFPVLINCDLAVSFILSLIWLVPIPRFALLCLTNSIPKLNP